MPHLVSGRVVHVVGRDTVGLGGVRVVLHRVTSERSGPFDSASTGVRGQYAFRFVADSGAVYLVSARYAGIDYFGPPVQVAPAAADTGMVVMAFDTSSTAPVTLAARHLIIAPVDADGLRNVVDLFVLENRGPMTRVSPDTLRPAWAAGLSRFAVNVHAGNSDFSASSLVPARDSIGLFAAIPPGQRDLELDYQIPPRSQRFEIPVDADAMVSNIVSEDATMRVSPGFTRADTVIGQKRYARWEGRMTAGVPVVLTFGSAGPPSWLVPALVGAMALVLIAATLRASRRGPLAITRRTR